MSERKGLINYITPDFDPKLIPRMKREKNKLIETRGMLPFSLQCNSCKEFMYRGKKFNGRTEQLKEAYCGIKLTRIYLKCDNCKNEICFKTDHENADYILEKGAKRTFELSKANKELKEEEEANRLEEEKLDSMKALENRALDSKNEMDLLDALDEMKAIKQRHDKLNKDNLIQLFQEQKNHHDHHHQQEDDNDEEIIKSVNFKYKRRNDEDAVEQVVDESNKKGINELIQENINKNSINTSVSSMIPVIVRKKIKIENTNTNTVTDADNTNKVQETEASNVLGMFDGYGSD